MEWRFTCNILSIGGGRGEDNGIYWHSSFLSRKAGVDISNDACRCLMHPLLRNRLKKVILWYYIHQNVSTCHAGQLYAPHHRSILVARYFRSRLSFLERHAVHFNHSMLLMLYVDDPMCVCVMMMIVQILFAMIAHTFLSHTLSLTSTQMPTHFYPFYMFK